MQKKITASIKSSSTQGELKLNPYPRTTYYHSNKDVNLS